MKPGVVPIWDRTYWRQRAVKQSGYINSSRILCCARISGRIQNQMEHYPNI